MNRIITKVVKLTTVFLFLALASTPASADTPASPEASPPTSSPADSTYVIGPGDILDISVWKAEGLTKTVAVLPDGTISFPLAGEIPAAGKTLAELKQELEKRLSRYVNDLVLTVLVQQSNSMMVYVVGRVNNPGRQVLNSRITVLQAIAMAGGPNPFAKKNDIRVLRQEGDKTVIHEFRYDRVIKGKNLEDNIVLKRGDVIVVP